MKYVVEYRNTKNKKVVKTYQLNLIPTRYKMIKLWEIPQKKEKERGLKNENIIGN